MTASGAGAPGGGLPDAADSLPGLFSPASLVDPAPLHRALRERDPVHWDATVQAWIVTGYAEVRVALQRFSSAWPMTIEQLQAAGLGVLEPLAQVVTRQMLFTDAPTHTRLRALCSAAFTPHWVRSHARLVQEVADGLLDSVTASGSMDVVADFAGPLPTMVTTRMLGLPMADHEKLKAWSADFAELLAPLPPDVMTLFRVLRSVQQMTAYFAEELSAGEASDRPGLLQAYAQVRLDGDRLTQEEVVGAAIITLVGGLETTTNLIGSGMLTLLRHPAQLARLRDDPSVLESGVEELLRFESPAQAVTRSVRQDTELGGKTLRQGDSVIAVVAAANRDPARFPDPDRLDLARTDNRHLAFGWGPHFCFGTVLARMEAQAAFRTLLHRLPGLRLPEQALAWHEHLGIRGLKALHVAFDPVAFDPAADDPGVSIGRRPGAPKDEAAT